MLELTVRVININLPVNHPILKKCRPLYEYSWFIQRIKEHQNAGKSRDEAILLAMKACEQEEIMLDFIREHGTEALNMLYTEFNMEDALEVRYEEGEAAGMKKGEEIGRIRGEEQKAREVIGVLIQRGASDEDIRIIAGCDQPLVDQVRKERSQEADAPLFT